MNDPRKSGADPVQRPANIERGDADNATADAPPDEGAAESLGRAIGDTVLGTVPPVDPARPPTPKTSP